MGLEGGCKSTPNNGLSRASCHRHTSNSDQASYSGMVARTICEDSVLNHRSKLPWMKHRSTNCQEQVAIDIIMNVPPWTARHNQVTKIKPRLQDHALSPRSGFELLAVKREGIMPMILRWFTARSCKDQCEGMDKASRKLSLVSNHMS
ncbi:hypothetical protein YC2023_113040 [Brassica napus]